jgi:hypothetical protein
VQKGKRGLTVKGELDATVGDAWRIVYKLRKLRNRGHIPGGRVATYLELGSKDKK